MGAVMRAAHGASYYGGDDQDDPDDDEDDAPARAVPRYLGGDGLEAVRRAYFLLAGVAHRPGAIAHGRSAVLVV